MFGPLNVFRSLPEASSTHSATAQQSPQGSSMKGLCAVVGIGTTAVLHSVLTKKHRGGRQRPSIWHRKRNYEGCIEGFGPYWGPRTTSEVLLGFTM